MAGKGETPHGASNRKRSKLAREEEHKTDAMNSPGVGGVSRRMMARKRNIPIVELSCRKKSQEDPFETPTNVISLKGMDLRSASKLNKEGKSASEKMSSGTKLTSQRKSAATERIMKKLCEVQNETVMLNDDPMPKNFRELASKISGKKLFYPVNNANIRNKVLLTTASPSGFYISP
ncbi:NB-ARC domain, LRR domain containing protein [Sesbania bispinosa]|nr:NB-ARC domain, LRR domain containing protein [Sesbania bispinosa]